MDEIQEYPNALVSLRYFKELMKDLHVIAAGSLMDFLLKKKKYSFPVDKVEFLQEFSPIAFEKLQSVTLKISFSDFEHLELLKWVRKYFFY